MAMSIQGTDPAPTDAGAAQNEHRHVIERELQAEFSELLDPGDIERLTSESLSRYEEASVRTFVPILAARTARRLARAHLAGDPGR
jgi:hypothetical protein